MNRSPGAVPEPGRGLLVVGDVVTDVVARHDEPLAPHTDTAARIAVLPGGAGANVACWAARYGAGVRLLARVGADSAEWHRAALLTAGVEPVLRVDDALPTAVVVALVDAAAERTLVTDSGAAFRLGPGDWDEALLDGGARGIGRIHLSGYLYFSAPGRTLAATVRKAAAVRGIPASVDPASAGFLRRLGPGAFLDAVQGLDLLLPNAAEAALLSGHDEPAAAAASLSARCGGATVVVTLGAAGAVAAERGAVVATAMAPHTAAVDTTGAGDAFTGGLLAARLAGAGLAEALAAGCRAGAEAVTVVGGRPRLRDPAHPGAAHESTRPEAELQAPAHIDPPM
ncbi:carbohydrate kinase family protein [Actinacidiphila acidipaludis]|uniref:Sugar kinase n=1 Tax=Actinacidiphila acidipaludis TaxID=2873382 RepID=A0ABS7Q3W3_9ACTN|nr:PfkB family carbohydrate kinase [Streptomyces acidipaludis]MBY8877858.1 sugar kinase [Streptomyces acidipaludis]